MSRSLTIAIALLTLFAPNDSSADATPARLLAPPPADGPVLVRARFDFQDINEIDDSRETFEFSGARTLEWLDPRAAFDPAIEGVAEKIYQGGFQFNEVGVGWYPQMVLVNEAGSYESNGVVLRVRPDGTSTLVETIYGAAETRLDMKRYPFDRHRLALIFEVLGFDSDRVRVVPLEHESPPVADDLDIPQWQVVGAALSTASRGSVHAGRRGVASALVANVDVARRPFYTIRLVIAPQILIVLLSFSVFWMDRSSLGDRIGVSFIGILTGVAYQTMISSEMPRISYVTMMHAFLSFSFATMCATVVINLVVGAMDKQGRVALGDRIDRRCRTLFPLAYAGLITLTIGIGLALGW